MKKTVISLIIIILIFGTILFFQIYNSSDKQTIANVKLSEENNIKFYHDNETSSTYKKDIVKNITEEKEQTNEEYLIKDTSKNSNTKISDKTNNQIVNEQEKKNDVIKENLDIKSTESTNSTSTSNNINTNTDKNNKKDKESTNKEETETPKNYISINSKILGKFTGYNYYNIYFLDNGYTLIQIDIINENKTLSNPNAEIRMYSDHYELYVEGMSNHIKVDPVYDVRRGNLVFPQKEYSKYNAVLQSAAGSGVLNSSAYKPYREKLEDIENNWTKLGTGRILCLSNYTYWEQVDNSETGIFEENAQAIVVTYKEKSYMIISGIKNYFEVKKYNE